jgi:molybdenum cofactor sulfurtransferase
VVLDAAAYAATHALDLSAVQPDFVPVSFYKLFGYPTGLGALLVRKEAARQLNKVYFGGGRCAMLQNVVVISCYVVLVLPRGVGELC